MKKLIPTVLIMAILALFSQCKPLKPEGQGITGRVTWVEGNQMPSISDQASPKQPEGKSGISRTVRVYPLVNISDMRVEEGLFTSIHVDPISETESDENGNYSLQLPPGRYSVFTVEENGLFASIFDGDGYVMPVTVREDEWTLVNIEINYMAAY